MLTQQKYEFQLRSDLGGWVLLTVVAPTRASAFARAYAEIELQKGREAGRLFYVMGCVEL